MSMTTLCTKHRALVLLCLFSVFFNSQSHVGVDAISITNRVAAWSHSSSASASAVEATIARDRALLGEAPVGSDDNADDEEPDDAFAYDDLQSTLSDSDAARWGLPVKTVDRVLAERWAHDRALREDAADDADDAESEAESDAAADESTGEGEGEDKDAEVQKQQQQQASVEQLPAAAQNSATAVSAEKAQDVTADPDTLGKVKDSTPVQVQNTLWEAVYYQRDTAKAHWGSWRSAKPGSDARRVSAFGACYSCESTGPDADCGTHLGLNSDGSEVVTTGGEKLFSSHYGHSGYTSQAQASAAAKKKAGGKNGGMVHDENNNNVETGETGSDGGQYVNQQNPLDDAANADGVAGGEEGAEGADMGDQWWQQDQAGWDAAIVGMIQQRARRVIADKVPPSELKEGEGIKRGPGYTQYWTRLNKGGEKWGKRNDRLVAVAYPADELPPDAAGWPWVL